MRSLIERILFTSATAIVISMLVRNDVRASDRPASGETCAHVYTDEDALAQIKAAEASVPERQSERKPIVMMRLGIEIRRLCNRRFEELNLGATETWQMSPGYDLTWWAAGPDDVPLDSDNARIHHVRIVPQSVTRAI